MYHNDPIICPVCNDNRLILKYETTYEYSYILDTNAPGLHNTKELLPYMYDSREQKDAQQYIECKTCRTRFPCYFDKWSDGITPQMIQERISSSYKSQLATNN